MNYYNFIGYCFLLLIVAYDGRSEELEALKEEVRSIRKETVLMRKERALVREEVANRKDQPFLLKQPISPQNKLSLVIE